MYLLDTDTASAALKGVVWIDRRLKSMSAGAWCISAITRAELRYGVARRPGATALAKVVGAFLAIARTEAWDRRAADVHGRLRAALAASGQPIGDFDEMIAAHALATDAILVTGNLAHFGRIPDLRVENWLR